MVLGISFVARFAHWLLLRVELPPVNSARNRNPPPPSAPPRTTRVSRGFPPALVPRRGLRRQVSFGVGRRDGAGESPGEGATSLYAGEVLRETPALFF